MSRYSEIGKDNLELLEIEFSKAGLDNYMSFTALHDGRAKEVMDVKKASAIVTYFSRAEVIFYINEEILDMLDDNTKKMVIEEQVSRVSFDTEKEKLNILPYDFSIMKGMLAKYNSEEILSVKESVEIAYQQLKEIKKEQQ